MLIYLVAIALCPITGALAARKGYNFYLWALAGGILGLLVLAFLPFTNQPQTPVEQSRQMKTTGNTIAGVIAVIGIGMLLLSLFSR